MNTFICRKCRKKEKDTNTGKKEQITRPSITYSQNATKWHLSSYKCCRLLDRICQWSNSYLFFLSLFIAAVSHSIHSISHLFLRCFDTVGWAAGRASGVYKQIGGVLVWLSVWSEVQTCIWPS